MKVEVIIVDHCFLLGVKMKMVELTRQEGLTPLTFDDLRYNGLRSWIEVACVKVFRRPMSPNFALASL